MINVSIVIFAALVSSIGFASPAILIEEDGEAVEAVEIQPLSQRSQLSLSTLDYENTENLRTKRRVGVGSSLLGQQGLAGMLIELNFTPKTSFLTGFGGGPGYSSFTFQWKHLFLGQQFSPYAGLGYSLWQGAGNGSLNSSNPTTLTSKFLNDSEKASGEFSVNLLNPFFGVQYHQLYGPYTGVSFFGEIVLLNELISLSPSPTAALGAMYYF